MNKMKKSFLIIISALLFTNLLYSQQIPLYSQYYFNPFIYNPAMTGSAEKANAFILSYFNRLRIEDIPQSEKNRRNNVEASIFQLSYFTRNNKTRYRGLAKHKWWAYHRSL